MRKVWSLSFLVMLAFLFAPGCSKKRVEEEEGCGTDWEAEAEPEGCAAGEGDGSAETEGCGEAVPEEGEGEMTEEGCAAETPEEGEGCATEEMGEEEEETTEVVEEEETAEPEMPEEGEGCAPEETEEVEEVEEVVEVEVDEVEEGTIPDDATATKEEIAVLSGKLKAAADRAYQAADLEKARELYRRVLVLEPQDQHARERFMRINEELGERVPVAADVIEREADRVSARRQQTTIEIKKRLAQAQIDKENNDWGQAISKYEEILNILNWYKYQADFPVTSEQTRALIEEAKAQRDLAADREAAEIRRQVQADEEARKSREKAEEFRTMKVFLQMASDAYDRGDYDFAQAHAQKVLALDPQNESAKELIRIAKETKYVADRDEIREQFNDEWRTIMEQLEYLSLPQTEIIKFPDSWDVISRRTPKKTGIREFAINDPRVQQITNTLSQTRVYEINWAPGDITLSGAVQYLRSVTGLNFVMSQKVKEEKADTEIDLKVDNVTVRQVLDIITVPNEMAWKVRNGVVMILDKEEALDKPVLQFYDVKDLVAKISDFPGQEINLVPSKYQPPEDLEPPEPTSPFEIDQLIEVIRLTIDPESWDTIEGADIQPKNNVLVVRTTPEIHQRIGQFLSDLRKNTGLLVSLEVRFLSAEDRFLRDVGVDIRGLGDQTGGVGLSGLGSGTNFDDSFAGSTANPSGTPQGVIPEPSSIGTGVEPGIFYGDGGDGEYKGRVENLFDFILNFDERGTATASATATGARGANSGGFTLQSTYLDDTQMEVILRAVEKSERIEQISAPRLTVYDTQRANVSVMTQNSYVQDFDVEIAQAAAIGDPIIQTIRDGIILDVRPIVSADRRFITMELRPTVADLVRPIPTFQTSLATGPPVTIQVPEIAISRVRTTITMPDGGTLLLGGIKFFRDLAAESGIPVLSQIPIISFLFTRKAKLVQRRNLLILIRAEVVVPEEHAPTLGVR